MNFTVTRPNLNYVIQGVLTETNELNGYKAKLETTRKQLNNGEIFYKKKKKFLVLLYLVRYVIQIYIICYNKTFYFVLLYFVFTK